MEAANGILVFLASVLVAADCSYPPFDYMNVFGYHGWYNSYSEHEDNDTSHYNCEERLDMCWPTTHSESILSELVRDLHNVVWSIDEICTDQASDCFSQFLDQCHNYSREYIDVLFSSGEYVCSERGRQLLEEARHSQCYYDSKGLGYVSFPTWRCMYLLPKIEEGADNYECQLLARRTQCESQATTEDCGQAIGTLLRELRNRENAVYFPHCSANSSSLAQARNSSCYFDKDQFRAVLELADSCRYSSYAHQEYEQYSYCRNAEEQTQCFIQAATQQCGQTFGTFIRELANTMDLYPECSADGSYE